MLCPVCQRECEVVRYVPVRNHQSSASSASAASSSSPMKKTSDVWRRPGEGAGGHHDEDEEEARRFAPAPAARAMVKKLTDRTSDGRPCKKHILANLVYDVLWNMHRWGGPEGLKIVKHFVPSYDGVA